MPKKPEMCPVSFFHLNGFRCDFFRFLCRTWGLRLFHKLFKGVTVCPSSLPGKFPVQWLEGGCDAGRTDHGAKAGGVPCIREDVLACRVCTPSLWAHREWPGFLPSYMTSRIQRNNVGIQEGRRALLMTINKQSNSPTLAVPLTGVQLPQHPRGLLLQVLTLAGAFFFFFLTSGFTCFCTPVDLKQCGLHYLATPFCAFSITCEIHQ